jgi:hypothetical protein
MPDPWKDVSLWTVPATFVAVGIVVQGLIVAWIKIPYPTRAVEIVGGVLAGR